MVVQGQCEQGLILEAFPWIFASEAQQSVSRIKLYLTCIRLSTSLNGMSKFLTKVQTLFSKYVTILKMCKKLLAKNHDVSIRLSPFK